MFSKKTDYEGWTNWETWNTWLMLNNEQPTHEALNQIVRQGGTPQDIHDFAITSVIGEYNSRSLQDAQEWNEIPKDERVDPYYEDLLNRLGVDSIEELPENAQNFHNFLGLGPNVEDSEPDLIDPDLVNWQEIHNATARGIWEDEAYETEDQFNDTANPYLQDFVPDSPDDIKFSRVASIHSSLVSTQIYDTWTGLRLPWAKVSAVEGAGEYLRRVLKQPGKKLMTDEGQQFLQYLASLGEDLDSLTPWLTAQYKKGNLGFSKIYGDDLNPDNSTVLERVKERDEDGEVWEGWRDPESGNIFSDEEAEHMPFALVDKGSNPPGIFDSSDLDKMAQWYNAKDHPTRQGANIQEMDLWDVTGAVKRHQKALKEEEETARAIEQTKDAGEIVHRFDNGYTIRKLNPEDLWAEGKLLGHCIGGQSYQDSLENGYIEVYSLRDPEGMPKVSWHYNQDGEVEEMQGRSGDPKQEYMEMIREWGEENDMPTELNQGEMYYDLGAVDDWTTFFELYSQHAEMGAWGIAAEWVNLNEEAEIDWGPVNIPAIVSDLFSSKGEGNIVEPIIQSGYFDDFVEEINKQVAEGDIDPNNPMQADYIKRIETASYQLRDPETGQMDSSSAWNYNEEEGTMHNPFEKHPEDPDYRLTPREEYDRENPTNALFDYQPEFFTRLVDVSEEPKDGFTPPPDTVPNVAIQVGKGERAIPWWGEDSTLDDQELSWSQPSPTPYGRNYRRQWPNKTVDKYTDKAFSQEQWLGPASPYFQRYPQEIQNKFLR